MLLAWNPAEQSVGAIHRHLKAFASETNKLCTWFLVLELLRAGYTHKDSEPAQVRNNVWDLIDVLRTGNKMPDGRELIRWVALISVLGILGAANAARQLLASVRKGFRARLSAKPARGSHVASTIAVLVSAVGVSVTLFVSWVGRMRDCIAQRQRFELGRQRPWLV